MIPKIKALATGDKMCSCGLFYSKEQIKREGIFKFGHWWANCSCRSTLTVKEIKDDDQKRKTN